MANSNNTRWHRLTPAEVAQTLSADRRTGLTTEEALRRLEAHGPNRLAQAKPRPAWLKFLDQFKSILIIVLLFGAALAWAIGDLKDSLVILIVVVFNAILGFYQEFRAEKTLAALKNMLAARSRVRRDGQVLELDAEHLVPGDLVLLEAGDRVPADGRLVAPHGVEVDEAALTGESHVVGKSLETVEQESPALGDRTNLLYMNTVVTRGRAEMLVTETGMGTEMGKLASLIAESSDNRTPLQAQLDMLGKRLAAIAGAVVVVILGIDFWRGEPWTEAAMKAVALAVAAIPEGLPAVVTVTLAAGMWRMARNRAILKKLSAVETLGSTTVICSDKTGTLTLNQMTARAGWFASHRLSVSGQGYEPEGEITCDTDCDLRTFLLPMAICTESRVRNGKLIGDPTEGALYVLAQKGGVDPELEQEKHPRIAEIPFDSAHKFMATFHHAGGQVEMLVKGAPDVLLNRCATWHGPTGTEPITPEVRTAIEDARACSH
jgi:Ca2+-transporting ATPase